MHAGSKPTVAGVRCGVSSSSTPSSQPATYPAAPFDLPRKVGFFGAVAVMVGVVIGSGIFKTPTSIAQHLGNPYTILALWLAAGAIALCGALTFAELATMFPRSGGIYVFLKQGYGSCTAFVFGWTYMLITKPAAAGGIAIVFAEHFNKLTGFNWDPKILTCAALFILTLINVLGVKGSARFAIVVTGLKFAALAAIIVLGLVAATRGSPWGVGESQNGLIEVPSPTSLMKAIAPVMAAIMWTYDGWSDVGAIAGEVTQPQRTLPRVFFLGTLSVTILYVLANFVYMWHIPLATMRDTTTIAPLLLTILVGPIGGTIVTAMIMISTLGSSHASVMTGARVTFAQAKDGLLFRFLGTIDPRYETPAIALWVQLALSCTAVLFLGKFEKLADSFVFTMWIFYGMAAVAIFILRIKQPDTPRPFRVPLYPVLPAIFVLASAAMTVLAIIDKPKETLPWIGVLAAGVPVYFVWRWIQARTNTRDRSTS